MGKFKAFIALSLIALGYGSALAALSSQDRAQIPTWQIIVNPGFESGTAGWVASGGTFTTTSTTANVGSGLSAGSWDSSAASQTLTGAAITIPSGAYGRPAILSCNIQTPTGTATHKIQAYDGTNVLAESTIQSFAQYRPASVMFQMPGSGSIRPRLISVASNEPNINMDDCVLQVLQSDVVVPVAQANLIASGYIAGTTNCLPTVVNASFADFGTDTDCPGVTVETNVGPGTLQTTDSDLPQFTINNLPPGLIRVHFQVPTASGAGTEFAFRVSDGTTNSIPTYQRRDNAGVTGQDAINAIGVFNYSTAGNRTFKLQCQGDGAASCILLMNQTARPSNLIFWVERFPSSSEMAVRPDQTDYGWTSYTPTFEGLGTVSGVKVYHRRVGENLEVNGYFKPGTPTAVPATISLPSGLLVDGNKITNTTSTAWVGWANQMTTSGSPANFTATNRFHVFYDGSTGGKLFLAVQAGSSEHTKNNGTSLYNSGEGASFFFSVPIQGWKVTLGAPLLIGSVTSNSTGMERVERATVLNNGSTASISSQSGSWLSSVSRASTGVVNLTIAAGMFSASPTCTCVNYDTGGEAAMYCGINNGLSTTNVGTTLRDAAGNKQDSQLMIHCQGPR